MFFTFYFQFKTTLLTSSDDKRYEIECLRVILNQVDDMNFGYYKLYSVSFFLIGI